MSKKKNEIREMCIAIEGHVIQLKETRIREYDFGVA